MRETDPRSLGDTRAIAQSMLLGDSPKGLGDHWRACFPEIVGRSAPMVKVLEMVPKVARSDSAVLILGESGTGKELIAAAIHRLSTRAPSAYVPLNCSAIPDNLLESELFGHEKGAFTGAERKVMGKFQYAKGGTIFLDEIGDMPANLQAKLLRVLQDQKFAPLGSNALIDADVRIVAATNMDLGLAIRDGKFRQDLFYRLNVLPIHLPPLRERVGDIPALLEHFIDTANRIHNLHNPCYLSDGLVRRLCAYHWPGNIRQLGNLISRLVVMRGGGNIEAEDLPPEMFAQQEELVFSHQPPQPQHPMMRATTAMPLPMLLHPAGVHVPEDVGRLPEHGLDLTQYIESLENDLIRQALERTGNNRNQAAKLLGLNRTTLVERIKKRQLTVLNAPSKEL